jgi:hypothetical protein
MNISQLKNKMNSLEYELQVKRQEERKEETKNLREEEKGCEFEQAQNKRKRRGNLSAALLKVHS